MSGCLGIVRGRQKAAHRPGLPQRPLAQKVRLKDGISRAADAADADPAGSAAGAGPAAAADA